MVLNYLIPDAKNINLGIPSSAYLHIPFCRRRCFYCDFPVSVVGDRKTGKNSGTIEQYVEVLCQEIEVTPVQGNSLKTVFFGGGTPSLLSVQQLKQILTQLDAGFGIATDAEISMEMDPGTFDSQQLQGYRSVGVNRISLGVQAFQPELLEVCGRSHSVSDIFAAVELVRKVGVPEFSLDLISGLPHQTLEQWQESLETAVAIAPTHISIYDLQVEAVTAFGRQYQPGAKPLPTDEMAAEMYRLAQQVLTSAGYEHYEISNYAKPGHQCRHNRVYWENRPYYAFGMGAASHLQGCRFTRPRKTREYYEWVQQIVKAGGVWDCPQTLTSEVLLETLMLGLRLAEGLSLSTLSEQFGKQTLQQIWTCLQSYYQQGWVEIVGESGEAIALDAQKLPPKGRLRLTDPEGFLFSNVILADLFSELG
ncbi:radical SAM family heme chaperone HemW [Coleofasciculus sp. FACHB-129]|uniref:radical SAM family heme chaperone HemW n=1 Tax=Cyanophyceae TaxID=3028117 RepID=UPI001682329B|nr:radical SAM family heme chaperone HemW [Coleofasciculus sp. FACHB-129]MBD1893648.1 coproporphyrinogen III oxidase [Coleofasciculus sp. FACHB-129]